jgi:hypothetical protein
MAEERLFAFRYMFSVEEEKRKLIEEEHLYAEPLAEEDFRKLRDDLLEVLKCTPSVNKSKPVTHRDYFYVY